MAGTISGKVTYTGSTTGTLMVVALTDTTPQGQPAAFSDGDSLGNYSMGGLPDGTYYIGSLLSANPGCMKQTDPWGFYNISGNIAPVVITGNNSVSGINITLTDGTTEHPNPFYHVSGYSAPTQILTLPSETNAGVEPALAYDGSSFYLYKHDYKGAGSAKIYVINPSTGEVSATHIFTLQSSQNGVSWLNSFLFVNGTLWATGGYGDPSGNGGRDGLFQINIAASSSSNQIPLDTSLSLATGMASDGTVFYLVVDSGTAHGVMKYDPAHDAKLPTTYLFKIIGHPQSICYADAYLWVGIDSLRQLNPATGTSLGNYNVPPAAAGVFANTLFWMWDGCDNTLKGYSIAGAGVRARLSNNNAVNFSLSSNYLNPLKSTAKISYRLPALSQVTLTIYNSIGQEIAALVNEQQSTGEHSFTFDASRYPSGVYFFTLKAGTLTVTKKLTIKI